MAGHSQIWSHLWAEWPDLVAAPQVWLWSTMGGGADAGVHPGGVIQGGVEEAAGDGKPTADGGATAQELLQVFGET